ncbi:RimK family alpha-L-glutamate ligase [Chromobacterium sp. IIBBL 290-4]|uniref:ATP-grasp domain-containing protein n=1 Tax=Chromobacterium sp. IIBBL 290-4 TaxID=2953890 RepID=UPI0020B887CA|nr:hypothetical protein [Chromobacterium sp. IIBBL 290-4]UTH73482.1 hypothetical protein NKT35_18355 [Chromobacterium sp. IIBBL 290-4]
MDELIELQARLDAAPQDISLHLVMAKLARALGDELGATAHLLAAHALQAYGLGAGNSALQPLSDIATGYFMKQDYDSAERWYHLLLRLDPNQAGAYLNLAAIHHHAGNALEEARCREHAYQLQRVFIEEVEPATRRLLILCVGRAVGNTPFDTLLAAGGSTRIKYALDCAAESEDAALPPHDLVFNAIGEPDIARAMLPRLRRFLAGNRLQTLNPPHRVAATQRHRLPARLAALDGVRIAPCLQLQSPPPDEAALQTILLRAGLRFPLLTRPAATQGGDGLQRCDTLEEALGQLRKEAGSHYLSSYIDYRSADGCYRKYRAVFIDRQPMPYHLAIAEHWMVHYHSAGMEEQPWKIEEERGFLENPQHTLGARAMATLHEIGCRLDLDYAGIDFSLLPNGELLVFEANPAMLVHWVGVNSPLAHKNRQVQNIAEAFESMLLARQAVRRPRP